MRFALLRRAWAADPPGETTHLDVVHGSARFRVALKRSARARRLTLRVSSATRAVVLTLPARVDLASAQAFADAHGGWIAARLAKLPERIALEPGALVPLRGIDHRIVHWSSVRSAARATRAPDGEAIIAVSGETSHVAKRVRDLLQREAKRDLAEAVARHTAALGVPARRITLRDTTSRWGSCSSRGFLNFSWRLILAPPFVLDYLAAHEVGHLAEMNHSHRFWRVVHRLCPRTEEAEAWLKRHGAHLHRYG